MIRKEQTYTLAQAVSTWGINFQTDMAIEEMSELVKAVLKWRRAKTLEQRMDCEKNIIEEIADVKIMIAQLEIMFTDEGIDSKQVQDVIDQKIARLENKLTNK